MILDEFVPGMEEIYAAFGRRMHDAQCRVYFRALRHWSGERWLRIVAEAVQSCETFPTIHKLREVAGRIPDGQAVRLDPAAIRCAWTTHGRPCHCHGTMSQRISDGGKFYCAWHFACVTEGIDASNAEAYSAWYARTTYPDEDAGARWDAVQGIRPITPRPTPVITWDAHHQDQIRGLALFGPDSVAWRQAPVALQQAARAYRTQHGTPQIGQPMPHTPEDAPHGARTPVGRGRPTTEGEDAVAGPFRASGALVDLVADAESIPPPTDADYTEYDFF